MESLGQRGFAIENEWYWRISENAQSFEVTAAVRDFLGPLARVAKDTVSITQITSGGDEVSFVLADEAVTIKLASGTHDRVALNHFVGDLNRALSASRHAFALVSPRRYELRGVLLACDELAQLAGDPMVLIPSSRPSWRSFPAPTPA
jgi:hypothetical protein